MQLCLRRSTGFIVILILGCLLMRTAQGEQVPSSPNRQVSANAVGCWSDLQSYAEQRAALEYVPEPRLIDELADLTYEQYREIQFKHEMAVWADGEHPFWLEFFHRGFVQRDRIECYLIPCDRPVNPNPNAPHVDDLAGDLPGSVAGKCDELATEVKYSLDQFRFGDPSLRESIPKSIGFAGVKIAGRFTLDGDPQELLTFIGSSYFRSRTLETVYGSSARGLAIDVGMNQAEEFPDFRKFWVLEPSENDCDLRILAFLDSPTLTGAYEFTFTPGESISEMAVAASLYFRRQPSKLAIAPLTSMWMWGDGLDGPDKDARPSVHDADGLSVLTDDGWQWRSFARLPYPSVASLPVKELRGFGLIQRDRDFENYQDYNARYHDRPSVWVQPARRFGKGKIELLEIPGAHEGVDNIGAYFVADDPIDIHQPFHLNYRTFFFRDEASLGKRLSLSKCVPQPVAKFRQLRVKRHKSQPMIDVTVDFQIEDSDRNVDTSIAPTNQVGLDQPRLQVQAIRGEVIRKSVERTIRGYQVQLSISPTEAAPIEIDVQVDDSNEQPLTEQFRYLCPHEQPAFVYPAVYTRIE